MLNKEIIKESIQIYKTKHKRNAQLNILIANKELVQEIESTEYDLTLKLIILNKHLNENITKSSYKNFIKKLNNKENKIITLKSIKNNTNTVKINDNKSDTQKETTSTINQPTEIFARELQQTEEKWKKYIEETGIKSLYSGKIIIATSNAFKHDLNKENVDIAINLWLEIEKDKNIESYQKTNILYNKLLNYIENNTDKNKNESQNIQ
jgi:hypothetical protein